MNAIKQILKKNTKLTLYSALAFITGIPAGILAYPLIKDTLPSLLKYAFAGVLTGSTAEIILKVFLRNTTASLIMLLTGITIITPLALLALNGLFVGLILQFAQERGISTIKIISGIIPHGIFELPAIFLSAALGIRVGIAIVTSKGARKKAGWRAFKEASAAYIAVVIPLLIIAAAVEILVSRNLLE